MIISSWPFRDNRAYLATVRRKGRRWRLVAISLPFAAAALVLQYSWPVLAAATLLVPLYLIFVVVPKWANEDIRTMVGEDQRQS